MKRLLIIIIIAISFSQIEPPDGLRSNPPRVWALTNCNIYTEPGISIENGILIIRDGFIEKVGNGISIPKDATKFNLNGATVYPGFIESWLPISTVEGLEKSKRKHWNFKVHPSLKTSDYYVSNAEELGKLHKLGFTSAHIVPDTGIFSGQSDLVQ